MKEAGSRSRQLWPLGEKLASWVQGDSACGTVVQRQSLRPMRGDAIRVCM
jgi:hypothetical protein